MVCTAQGFHSASPEEKGCESLEYNSKFFTNLEPEKYLASKIKERKLKILLKDTVALIYVYLLVYIIFIQYPEEYQ